jgi:hypothetical protein
MIDRLYAYDVLIAIEAVKTYSKEEDSVNNRGKCSTIDAICLTCVPVMTENSVELYRSHDLLYM